MATPSSTPISDDEPDRGTRWGNRRTADTRGKLQATAAETGSRSVVRLMRMYLVEGAYREE